MASRVNEQTERHSGNGSAAESQARAVAALPKDVAILRMEAETISALAATRPRNMEQIKADLGSILRSFPGLAEEAIYNKPVGKNQGGQQTYARNLSVRSAEALAEAYGYNSVSADVEEIDADHVKITGCFLDYQRGRVWRDSNIVSKFYRAKTGHMVRHADDRFYGLVVKAEKAKVIREVILRCVDPGLKQWFWAECERMVDEILDDNTVNKIIGQFSSKGVGLEDLEKLVGKPMRAGWTKEDRKNLLGIWNSLKDGETTIQEVFGAKEEKKETPKPSNVSASDLTKTEPPKEEKKEPPKEEPKQEDAPGVMFPNTPDTREEVPEAPAPEAAGRGRRK